MTHEVGPAVRATALVLALAGALAVRVGVAGVDGVRDPVGGVVFALLLLAVVAAAGAVPAVPSRGALVRGAAGGLVLCLVPLAVLLQRGPAPLPPDGFPAWAVVVGTVAVAEEVLLRGALFEALEQVGGSVLALALTTVAFALLHVPLYGWEVLPLDLAVGLWLGGLRLATGGAAAPAAAHVVADWGAWWLR